MKLNFRVLLLAGLSLVLAACQSTTIRDAWSDPNYAGGPLKKMFVLGISGNAGERRTFEDIMVAKLNAAGAQAVPAYRSLPAEGRIPEADLDRAVRESGADALLLTRIRRVDTRTRVSTAMVPGPMGPGWYGWYSGWYAVPDVQQYDIATVETTVFATATKAVIWTGVTETFEPTSVQKDAPGFADVIIGALRERKLLPVPRATSGY